MKKTNYHRQHWRNILRQERNERIFNAAIIALLIITMLATVAWTVTDTARIIHQSKQAREDSE